MLKRIAIVIAAFGLLVPTWVISADAGSQVGGGLHYLRTLGDIEANGFDQNSYSILGSYQYTGGSLLKFEGDVEYVFDFIGSSNAAWVPQAYVLAGGLIYGGVGIGITNFDGEWASEPFYALRAGVDIPLAKFHLDMFASYQFWNDDDLKALTGDDLNSITFAAVLRVEL